MIKRIYYSICPGIFLCSLSIFYTQSLEHRIAAFVLGTSGALIFSMLFNHINNGKI